MLYNNGVGRMKLIYLVRHAETEWNKERKYQGGQDIPLSDAGIEQARQLAVRLRKVKFDLVYSSPLLRARQTAEIIIESNSPHIILEPAFCEINHGLWEGLRVDEIAERFPHEFRLWKEKPHQVKMPQGESLHDLWQRVVPRFLELVNQANWERILIVGHGGVNRVILMHCLKMELRDYWKLIQNSTCVNLIEKTSHGFQVKVINDLSHLETPPPSGYPHF